MGAITSMTSRLCPQANRSKSWLFSSWIPLKQRDLHTITRATIYGLFSKKGMLMWDIVASRVVSSTIKTL